MSFSCRLGQVCLTLQPKLTRNHIFPRITFRQLLPCDCTHYLSIASRIASIEFLLSHVNNNSTLLLCFKRSRKCWKPLCGAQNIMGTPHFWGTQLLGCKSVMVSLVKKIISRLEHGNLVDIQVASLFALGFFGFLRWDDLSRLTDDSLQFADTHLAIFLVQLKNDQFWDGSWVLVAHCSSSPCLVAVVKKFLKVGRHEKNSRLFYRILHTEKRMELRKEPMLYSRANELIKWSCRRKSWILSCMESTVLGPEEQQQQQPLVYLIGYSKGRGDGIVTGQKTITFRSPWSHC